MMSKLRTSYVLLTLVVVASSSVAAVIDGSLGTDEYGPAIAIQDVKTSFGNNLSELNVAYGQMTSSGAMELLLTGNLEPNGNGLVLFIDAVPGGGAPGGVFGSVGGARIDDWGTDTNGGVEVTPTPGGPSIVSTDFDPEFGIELNSGGDTGDYYVNIIDLTVPNEPSPNRDIFLGQNLIDAGGVTQTYVRDDGATPSGDITHAFNNTNMAGINGTFDPTTGDPLSATTGFEFSFDSTFLGTGPGDSVKVLAFITNGGGDYLSNQFLPGLQGTASGGADPDLFDLGPPGDLGGVPLFDFNTLLLGGGPTYFVVEPTSTLACDFNGDNLCNLDDIDALTMEIATGGSNLDFDLNGDGMVNLADVSEWLSLAGEENLGPGRAYLEGDANLDGSTDVTDFNAYNNNKFTTTGKWSLADFNADGSTDVSDFNLWNGNKFQTADGTAMVPEPGTVLLLGLGALALLLRRHRELHRRGGR